MTATAGCRWARTGWRGIPGSDVVGCYAAAPVHPSAPLGKQMPWVFTRPSSRSEAHALSLAADVQAQMREADARSSQLQHELRAAQAAAERLVREKMQLEEELCALKDGSDELQAELQARSRWGPNGPAELSLLLAVHLLHIGGACGPFMF